jgi:hypothetical protein
MDLIGILEFIFGVLSCIFSIQYLFWFVGDATICLDKW